MARWPYRELATSCESGRNVSAVDLLRPRICSNTDPVEAPSGRFCHRLPLGRQNFASLAQGDVPKVSLILLAGSMPDGSDHLW
jgi:hypothetical protein